MGRDDRLLIIKHPKKQPVTTRVDITTNFG